jgi:hypothetical protein
MTCPLCGKVFSMAAGTVIMCNREVCSLPRIGFYDPIRNLYGNAGPINPKEALMAKTVEELLNTPGDQIKPPPLLPVGTYLVGIVGQPEIITSTQKQTPGCAIKYKFWQARDDVDADNLQAILAESGQTLNDVEMTDTFYFTEKSLFMFKQFYANALEIPESYSPKQAMAEMPGKQLLIHIRHKPRSDGSGLYAEIDTRTRAP